jgi:competence protein ComFC
MTAGLAGWAREAWRAGLDLLWPETCGGCRRALPGPDGLCEACSLELLRLVSLPSCPRCGATLGPFVSVVYNDGCPRCPTPLPAFSSVTRLGPYAGPIRRAVRELKYHGWHGQGVRLAGMLSEAVSAGLYGEDLDVVIPVPMYWTRRLLRRSDHAALLADRIARGLPLPCCPELLRTRNTPPQVHLARSQRFENIRGAFAVRSRRVLAGARVLLVDDVTTTTATANESARTLLRAGALRVHLAVLAKGEPPWAYAERAEMA